MAKKTTVKKNYNGEIKVKILRPTMFLLDDLEKLGGKIREVGKKLEEDKWIPGVSSYVLEEYESLVSQSDKLKRKIMERLK